MCLPRSFNDISDTYLWKWFEVELQSLNNSTAYAELMLYPRDSPW